MVSMVIPNWNGESLLPACLHFDRTDFANLITVAKSIDGGKTFGPAVGVRSGTNVVDFNDKPYLGGDATGGPFDGRVYVS